MPNLCDKEVIRFDYYFYSSAYLPLFTKYSNNNAKYEQKIRKLDFLYLFIFFNISIGNPLISKGKWKISVICHRIGEVLIQLLQKSSQNGTEQM